jgi:hypothetical protein
MGLIAAGVAGAALMVGGAAMSAGKKVNVPAFQKVNTEKEQEASIKQNIASLQSGSELATKTTASEQTLLESQLRRAIPGYDQLISQAGKNIGSNLRGEISTDVQSQLQRSSAGRALSGGFGAGSGVGRNLSARDFGLTSMQMQNQGLQQAQSFIQQQRMFGMVQPFSTSSMFITPAQRVGVMQQQQQAQYGRDLQAAQVAAMPDPTMSAFGSAISSAGGFYGGAMMQQSLGGGRQSAPYNYGNVDNMMNGPSQNLYSQPSSSSGYGDYGYKY